MCLDAQKNRLNETLLLSTDNMCVSWEIRKLVFDYVLLFRGLLIHRYTLLNSF